MNMIKYSDILKRIVTLKRIKTASKITNEFKKKYPPPI